MKLVWLNLLVVALISVFSFLGCGKGKPKEEEKEKPCSEITNSSDCGKNTKCLWQPGSSGPNTEEGPIGHEEGENPDANFEGGEVDGDKHAKTETNTAGKCIEKPAANNSGKPQGPGHEEGPANDEAEHHPEGGDKQDDEAEDEEEDE